MMIPRPHRCRPQLRWGWTGYGCRASRSLSDKSAGTPGIPIPAIPAIEPTAITTVPVVIPTLLPTKVTALSIASSNLLLSSSAPGFTLLPPPSSAIASSTVLPHFPPSALPSTITSSAAAAVESERCGDSTGRTESQSHASLL